MVKLELVDVAGPHDSGPVWWLVRHLRPHVSVRVRWWQLWWWAVWLYRTRR